jgi:hypothetical protein
VEAEAVSDAGLRPGLLVSFHPGLLANSLAGQGFFYSPLLAGFQIERMSLDLLDDVFLLDLALEPAKSVL